MQADYEKLYGSRRKMPDVVNERLNGRGLVPKRQHFFQQTRQRV
jgi:hypothetical protein